MLHFFSSFLLLLILSVRGERPKHLGAPTHCHRQPIYFVRTGPRCASVYRFDQHVVIVKETPVPESLCHFLSLVSGEVAFVRPDH